MLCSDMSAEEASSSDSKPHLGVPRALFIENVEAYLTANSITAESAYKQFQELHQKYQLMGANIKRKIETSADLKAPASI